MRHIWFCMLALLLAGVPHAYAEKPLTVFAAASLSEAMTGIAALYETETGIPVTLSFAGTGTLARQIEAGAPADVFVSADTLWMDYLLERGAVRQDSRKTLASNRMVIVGQEGADDLTLTAEELSARLAGRRMAMADPETVPAGRYGKAALMALGLWPAVKLHLAPMENVRVALAAAARGDTPLALVYATDAAIEPGVTVLAVLPENSHPPIAYPAALTQAPGHPGAQAFLEFLAGPEAAKILHSFGFVTDKEE